MLERIAILIAVCLFAAVVALLWRWWLHRKTGLLRRQGVSELVQRLNLPALPTLLYFTTQDCAQCRYQQTPTLERLRKSWGENVHIRKLDAIEHDELARHFSILTVPSTIVLDCAGQVVAINHGLATAGRLEAQLRPLIKEHEEYTGPHTLAPTGI